MIYAVLLSGGKGTRMGFNVPKQFIEINNKPLLAYCIEKFVQFKQFEKIIISSPKEHISQTKDLINRFFPQNPKLVVIEGGETRQDTLMNSVHYIEEIDDSDEIFVINHDAARIFVSTDQIEKCIQHTLKYGAASPIIPSTDVIVETDGNSVSRMPNRYDLVHVQTPQGFELHEYVELFNDLDKDDIDSVHEIIRVYFLKNKHIFLFEGEKSNFKITNLIDLDVAKAIISKER